MSFSDLSDQALLADLGAICSDERHLIARQLRYLSEVEDRRLELRGAYSSMFDFCTRALGMSDGIAYRRLNAARLARTFPALIGAIERGDVHLCGLVELKDVLSEETFDEILAEAKGKSIRKLQQLAAGRKAAASAQASLSLVPAPVSAASVAVETGLAGQADGAIASEAQVVPLRFEPLPEPHCRMHFDANAALVAKLDRVRDLLGHSVPNGDLAAVFERAVDVLLTKLEKERLGKTSRPLRVQRGTKPGRIARATRREVFERDGEQCTFVAEGGARCPSRMLLELDHIESRATGGSDEASNLRVRCRAHNRLHAEDVFGAEHVSRSIDERRRASRRRQERTRAGARGSRDGARRDAGEAGEETTVDLCIKGLTNMGFVEAKARRVVGLVAERRGAQGHPSFEALFREALTVLT